MPTTVEWLGMAAIAVLVIAMLLPQVRTASANLWGTIHWVRADLLSEAIASLREAVQLTDADLRDEFRIWRKQHPAVLIDQGREGAVGEGATTS